MKYRLPPQKADKFESSSVAVEWLVLVLRVREVLGSNLQPKDRISLQFLVVFLSSCKENPGNPN
jgi:hypothetical protein